jgi:hypothetical protein
MNQRLLGVSYGRERGREGEKGRGRGKRKEGRRSGGGKGRKSSPKVLILFHLQDKENL